MRHCSSTRAPRPRPVAGEAALGDPLWWPALTRYVAEMQAAWLAFLSAGRLEHPELRIVFTMLAGLAPLHQSAWPHVAVPTDRSAGKQRPARLLRHLLLRARRRPRPHRGARRGGALLYGSDRPVVEPGLLHEPRVLDWDLLADGAARAFGSTPFARGARALR